MADESYDGNFCTYEWLNNVLEFQIELKIDVRNFTVDPIKESEIDQQVKNRINGIGFTAVSGVLAELVFKKFDGSEQRIPLTAENIAMSSTDRSSIAAKLEGKVSIENAASQIMVQWGD